MRGDAEETDAVFSTKISGEAPSGPCFVRCILLFCGFRFELALINEDDRKTIRSRQRP